MNSLVLASSSLKFFKGMRPIARHKVMVNIFDSFGQNLCRKFVLGRKEKAGRTSYGFITSFHRGGGVKKNKRIVDFYGRVFFSGIVLSLDYDPKRSSFLALVCNWKGFLSYRIAAHNLRKGQFVGLCKKLGKIESNGFLCLIGNILVGTRIFNVEIAEGSGGCIARAAGTFCKLVKKLANFGMLLYPSGRLKAVHLSFFCTLGRVSNMHHHLVCLGTAGVSRRLGFRPVVRGIRMNPVDHPHGGRTAIGRSPVSPYARLTKSGYKRKKKFKKDSIQLKFMEEFNLTKIKNN